MSRIVTERLREVTLAREARYLGAAADRAAVRIAGCPGIATLRDPVAIESTLEHREAAAA